MWERNHDNLSDNINESDNTEKESNMYLNIF